jgi:multidrug efflux pump subunit AcrA (membrane-fusion protein)
MRPVLIGLLSIGLLAACSGPYSATPVAAKEEPSVEVQVLRVHQEVIPEIIPATGELFAEEKATIGAKVPGRVAKLHVDLGSIVTEGQVLAEIEKEEYEFRVRQAEALVSQTRARLGILSRKDDDVTPEETAIVRRAAADLKEARFVFQTSEELAKEGILSRIDLEKAEVRRQASEAAYQGALEEVMQLRAQLSERRSQLDLMRQNLADCLIRSPFAGAVTERVASLGEFLTVNAPVVTVVRQHPLRIRLEVPERLARSVRIGQRIDVRVEGSSRVHRGHVARLSPAIESDSRSLLVEGEVANEQGLLRPGAFAEGQITVDPDARGIAVPRDAVVAFAGIERVFVVADGRLQDRVVKTGRLLTEDRVEILDGLEVGSAVVREADDRLTSGQAAVLR